MINITNEDNMELMARYPNKYFDLAIVDPPYGINVTNQSQGKGGGVAKKIIYKKTDWDKYAPNTDYFEELIRVSKNQIIWGANHFISRIPFDSSCWIVWDKDNGQTDFADCELAWTSFKTSVRMLKWKWVGMLQQNMKNKEQRIHPTQKPVALYKWLLKNYANEGDKILDTHLGSGSIAIACHDMGFDLTACELDSDYFKAAMKRLTDHQKQLKLL
jgi:site-specific DNA-methyltransferase (adenine-specific)